MKKLLLLILLTSCSYHRVENEGIAFQEPGKITKALAGRYVHPEQCSILQNLTGLRKLKDLGRELLKDIGGLPVLIPTEYGYLEGMYFDPDNFRQNEAQAYKKWRQILAEPKNIRLSQIYEVNYSGNSLPALLSMPRMIKPLKKAKSQRLGVLCLPAAGIDYELDPQFILTFLMRGMHVLVINYSGIEWKKVCTEAKAAALWFSGHIHAAYGDITICGKSFGSGPAVYAAIECPGANLIVDRGFARFSDAISTNFFLRSIIEKYYRFPNEDWISHVQGKILIIEAREDLLWQGHSQRLFDAVAPRKEKALRITVSGGHYGLYFGDQTPSWYTDDRSQAKLDTFLRDYLVN